MTVLSTFTCGRCTATVPAGPNLLRPRVVAGLRIGGVCCPVCGQTVWWRVDRPTYRLLLRMYIDHQLDLDRGMAQVRAEIGALTDG